MSAPAPPAGGWPDEVRDLLMRIIGSFPLHEDGRGPDNSVLANSLPCRRDEAEPDEFLGQLADAVLVALAPALAAERAAGALWMQDAAVAWLKTVAPNADEPEDTEVFILAAMEVAALAPPPADADALARVVAEARREGMLAAAELCTRRHEGMKHIREYAEAQWCAAAIRSAAASEGGGDAKVE